MKKHLFILASICILLSGCTKKPTIGEVNKSIDFLLLYEETMEQQLSDGRFTYWPDEIQEDIYSTYYSIEILKLLNYKYENPAYNLEDLNQKISSLYDLYLFVSLFSENIKNNKNDVDILVNILNEYKINDYLYTIDKSYIPMYIEKDDVVLMATLYAISIYEMLELEYQTEALANWQIEFFQKSILVEDILDRYSQLYMLICIAKFIDNNYSVIYNEMSINFDQYENELINCMDNINFIFGLYNYLNIIETTDLESMKINKDIAADIVEKHIGDTGGFVANEGDVYNSLPMFIITKLAVHFGLDINYEDVINIILLHKRADDYFIPYIITDGDLISTYYSYYICDSIIENGYNPTRMDGTGIREFNVDYEVTILRIKELINNYKPSYYTIDEIRTLLEYCWDNNIPLADINMGNVLNSTIEYLAELDDTNEDEYRRFMAYSLIVLIDYQELDDEVYNKIKKYNPSSMFEAYHICVLLDNLRKIGIDLNEFINNTLTNQLTLLLYKTIGENGLFCTNDSEEAVTLLSNYMGIKVYNVIQHIINDLK